MPKDLKLGASKHQQITKNCKNTSSKHTHNQNLQKNSLEGVEPLKLITVTHFSLFSKRLRARTRHPKWELKWSLGHPKSQNIWKNEHSKKHQKHNTEKVGHFMTSKWEGFFVAGAPPKSQQSAKSSKWAEGATWSVPHHEKS